MLQFARWSESSWVLPLRGPLTRERLQAFGEVIAGAPGLGIVGGEPFVGGVDLRCLFQRIVDTLLGDEDRVGRANGGNDGFC